MLLVDTNVLLDVLEDDPAWADWSVRQLRDDATDAAIECMEIVVRELPRPALFLAGRAFVKYRKAGGTKANVLADFFVGAHAAVLGCGIITRDARRYRTYFPAIQLVTPG
jgi:hypothetical protein